MNVGQLKRLLVPYPDEWRYFVDCGGSIVVESPTGEEFYIESETAIFAFRSKPSRGSDS